MPKKKNKGAEKEKKGKKSRHMNEKDILSHEQEILDCNRQIARLRTRNQELENEIDIVRKKMQQLEEDRSDVIAHLKRNLQYKIVEAQELSDKLYALDELRKVETSAFRKKEEDMEEEYRVMENNLTTEIQLSAGKLSALEEWRVARNEMMKKFEIQQEQIHEQEKRHKEKLYEVERNLIINKAKLKKEMEERLTQLAQNFRETTNLRIADTTKRAIHENIAMNKELDLMLTFSKDMNKKMAEYKERDYNLRLQSSLYKDECKLAKKKIIKQSNVIKQLVDKYYNINSLNAKVKLLEKKASFNEKLALDYESKYQQAEQRIQELKTYIENGKDSKNKILQSTEQNNEDIVKLKEVIKRAKDCVATVLKVYPKQLEKGVTDVKETFLITMLDILGSDMYLQTKNNFKNEQILYKYTQGNLGFICSHKMQDHDISSQCEELIGDINREVNEENICKNIDTFIKKKDEELKSSDSSQSDIDEFDIFSSYEDDSDDSDNE